jgi:transketolase
MRRILCQTLVDHATEPDFVFLTGDLGFQALEPLQAAAGPRFINAGVAEQNMVSVAAGLAWTGMHPWVYSICPFIYARPYEQIRNDVCMHDAPVKIVGNGGGYAYGVMGATHHALGDYGALLCLDNMHAFVPAFNADVPPIVQRLLKLPHPAYLRLGRCELPAGFALPEYGGWRCLVKGNDVTVVVVGPLAGGILQAVLALPENQRPNFWVVTELPIVSATMPAAFLEQVSQARHVIMVEEHVAQGSAGAMLLQALAAAGRLPARFSHHYAAGYPSRCYGSQVFHRKESGLDAASILAEVAT